MAQTSRSLSAVGPQRTYMMTPTCSCARAELGDGGGVVCGKGRSGIWHLEGVEESGQTELEAELGSGWGAT